MNSAIKNVMLHHYLEILKEGFTHGNVNSLREFINNDFDLCDWCSREIIEDGMVTLNYVASVIANSSRPYSVEIVKLNIDGVSDRGYKTTFEREAVFARYVQENEDTYEKKYYETVYCLKIDSNYMLESVIALADASFLIME